MSGRIIFLSSPSSYFQQLWDSFLFFSIFGWWQVFNMDFWSMNNTKRNTFQIHYLFSDRVFWKLRITELKWSDWGSGFFLARGESSRVWLDSTFKDQLDSLLSQIHDCWLDSLKNLKLLKSQILDLLNLTRQLNNNRQPNDYSGGSWLKQVLTRPTLSSHCDICHSFLEEWVRWLHPNLCVTGGWEFFFISSWTDLWNCDSGSLNFLKIV